MISARRLVGATAIVLLLAACGGGSDGGSTDGGDTPGPAPDAGVQVVATGAWNDIGLGSGSWGWGVLLENPGAEAIRVDMDVNALNSAGEVVDSMTAMWTVVVAGSQGGISGGFFGVPRASRSARSRSPASRHRPRNSAHRRWRWAASRSLIRW